MGRDVIIPLDMPNSREVFDFLSLFEGDKPYVKVGMELFYAEGPQIVKDLKSRGHSVFLDLKLHDIPNTVMRAMSVLSSLGADMINMHAAGTIEMMRAGVTGAAKGTKMPILLGVTQLTSTDQARMERDLLINRPIEEVVLHYAACAREAGLNGVVCSPLEAGAVKRSLGDSFLTVTPGIRFEDSAADDQSRVMTPARAREAGSDYIVVGRPIIAAADPVAAYTRCVSEFIG